MLNNILHKDGEVFLIKIQNDPILTAFCHCCSFPSCISSDFGSSIFRCMVKYVCCLHWIPWSLIMAWKHFFLKRICIGVCSKPINLHCNSFLDQNKIKLVPVFKVQNNPHQKQLVQTTISFCRLKIRLFSWYFIKVTTRILYWLILQNVFGSGSEQVQQFHASYPCLFSAVLTAAVICVPTYFSCILTYLQTETKIGSSLLCTIW